MSQVNTTLKSLWAMLHIKLRRFGKNSRGGRDANAEIASPLPPWPFDMQTFESQKLWSCCSCAPKELGSPLHRSGQGLGLLALLCEAPMEDERWVMQDGSVGLVGPPATQGVFLMFLVRGKVYTSFVSGVFSLCF